MPSPTICKSDLVLEDLRVLLWLLEINHLRKNRQLGYVLVLLYHSHFQYFSPCMIADRKVIPEACTHNNPARLELPTPALVAPHLNSFLRISKATPLTKLLHLPPSLPPSSSTWTAIGWNTPLVTHWLKQCCGLRMAVYKHKRWVDICYCVRINVQMCSRRMCTGTSEQHLLKPEHAYMNSR